MLDYRKFDSHQKLSVLLNLIGQLFDEVGRLKKLRWNICVLVVSMLLGIDTFIIMGKIPLEKVLSLAVVLISLLIFVYGMVCVHMVERKLCEEISTLKKCRHMLGLMSEGVYCEESLIKGEFEKLEHLHRRRLFMTLGLYMAMALSFLANIVFVLSHGSL